ncbi:MAG: OmpH family outer membrane protein [Bacteroidota bacterium]|nr:OmpH family outer membrane protein [Bacteroidota bacterium]
MKNISTLLSVLALILVGVLFYLLFSSKKIVTTGQVQNKDSAAVKGSFRLAYFEMDSVENNFEMVKEVKSELNKKEEAITYELSSLEKKYRDKVAGYQSQGANMTQVQSEMAQKDVLQMQQNMQSRKQTLDQEYQEFYVRRMREVKDKISEFLKEYNKDKAYTYIVSDDPGLFYYRDTAYNITRDVIAGLNNFHKKKN